MKLAFTSFEKALASLNEALIEYDRAPDAFIRDSCIQRFEYTYELAHKMLKRQLEEMSPNPTLLDGMSFADMIRLGTEQGLLANGWDAWRAFREARSAASHAHDEKTADAVFAQIPAFRDEAAYLLGELQKRNA